jgi:acyl carrier protein
MAIENLDKAMVQLFRSIFAELNAAEEKTVTSAEREALESWDSANHLLLITCLEEEFGIRIPEDQIADVDSFARARALVGSLVGQ